VTEIYVFGMAYGDASLWLSLEEGCAGGSKAVPSIGAQNAVR